MGSIQDDFINLVLYGQNRTGKTTLACEFSKPLLLVSFEPGNTGGARSVRKSPGVTFIRVTSKEKAIRLAGELRNGGISNWRMIAATKTTPTTWHELKNADGSPSFTGQVFKTHVLDTCTSLQDVILAELIGLAEVPVQLGWGTVPDDAYRERSEQAKEVMRLYRDLPANTVFVCQEKDHNPPKTTHTSKSGKVTERAIGKLQQYYSPLNHESWFAGDMGAATFKWMMDACDFVCRLSIDKERRIEKVMSPALFGNAPQEREEEVETGKLVRRLRLTYHPNCATGFRSDTPEMLPEFIEASTSKEMFDKFMKAVKGQEIK